MSEPWIRIRTTRRQRALDLDHDRPAQTQGDAAKTSIGHVRRRILYLVVTLAEIRPWEDNDDPSEFTSLSSDWPHASEHCPGCVAVSPWFWTAHFSAEPAQDRSVRGLLRAARAAFESAYPSRYREVEEHRRQVRRAALEAPVAAKRVQAEAAKWLVRGLAEARKQGFVAKVPREGSRQHFDGPWPYWYGCVEIAQSEAAEPLLAALREAYPARFDAPSGSAYLPPYKDPARYAAALLRAVIAEAIVARRRPTARSRATRPILEELHRAAAQDGQTFASLWLIDDLDLAAVNRQSFDGLTFHAPRELQDQNVVSSLMPEAMWASEPYRMPHADRGGFIYASQGGARGDHWETTKVLNERIGKFALAIRLATGSTGPNRMVWMGEPSWIHVEMPEAHPQVENQILGHWRRVAAVKPEDLSGLVDLVALIGRAQEQSAGKGQKQGTVSAVSIALGRYSRSYAGLIWQDTVLDLATALEACFGPENKEEIGLTLRTRAAHLLGRNDAARADEIYGDLADLYDLRSDLIHGNARFRHTPQELCDARGYAHTFPSDRLGALLDRWRDIVRRAIVARLLLADTRCGEPLWPLRGNQVAVDRCLVRPDKREQWCQRLVDEAAALSLPLLIEPAPPLIDYLHR
jgi:hypothetical protein